MFEVLIGALLLSALATSSSSNVSGKARFTGVTCPVATPDLVSWSTGSWWYPVPTEDLEWSQFRDAVALTPEVVEGSIYLPWKRNWEPWRRFLGRPEANWEESFYETELPSGKKAWVWVGSGVEHWFTLDGDLDVGLEEEILQRAYARLEQWEQEGVEIDLERVQQATLLARAGF